MDKLSLLPSFALYLKSQKFLEFFRLFIEKAGRQKMYDHLTATQVETETTRIKTESEELLECLSSGKGSEYILRSVEVWRGEGLPLAPQNEEGVRFLVNCINIRKYSFIKLLREYEKDVEKQEEIILELVEFYSIFFLSLIQAYSEVQNQKLQLEKDLTQSLINHSVNGISAYDLNLNVTEWNPVVERSTGVKKEDILGKNYFDFFPKYKGTPEAQFFRDALSGATIALEDRQYSHKDGWFDAHFVPILDNKKEVIGALSITHDVTARKEAEIKIKEDQHFISTLADSSPDVITVYDLERGLNIYSSKEIYQILGYSEEELKFLIAKGVQGLVEAIHPEDLAVVLNFLENYKKYTEDKPRELEYRIKDSNGEYRWILDRYNVFKKSDEGFPIQIIGIARDNTLRRKAEEKISQFANDLEAANEELRAANEDIHARNQELAQALKELKSAEESLTQLNNELEERVSKRTKELTDSNKELVRINSDLDSFIYTASHDLKAPILNIEGLTNALDKKLSSKLENSEKELLEMIRASTNRFKRTINDLTEISKVQKDIENHKRDLLISKVIEDSILEMQPLIKAAGDVTIDTDLKVQKLRFAGRHLRSIIYNLLSNAIKYRSPERSLIVKIKTFRQGEEIVLSISDNGLGIESHQLPKIFQMFKRVHHHTEGTGVGLYILKRILENSNGRVEVESEINKGSTFLVFFRG